MLLPIGTFQVQGYELDLVEQLRPGILGNLGQCPRYVDIDILLAHVYVVYQTWTGFQHTSDKLERVLVLLQLLLMLRLLLRGSGSTRLDASIIVLRDKYCHTPSHWLLTLANEHKDPDFAMQSVRWHTRSHGQHTYLSEKPTPHSLSSLPMSVAILRTRRSKFELVQLGHSALLAIC